MNQDKIDILKEISNIGTSKAANALSQMIGRKVMIQVPELKIIPITSVPEVLGGAEIPIIGVYFKISGDLSGRLLLVFDRESGHRLASLLTGSNDISPDMPLKDIAESSIKETANIIGNSYLNAVAELTGTEIFPSTPFYAEDILGAVIDFLLIEIAEISDEAIILQTVISSQDVQLKGTFLIFPDEEFIEKLFEKINLHG